MHAALETLTDHAGRVHARQRSWAGWQRVGWWLLLVPVALACWASLQTSVGKQRVGWALAAASLLLIGVSAAGGSETDPAVSDTEASTRAASSEADVTSGPVPFVGGGPAPASPSASKAATATPVAPVAAAPVVTTSPPSPVKVAALAPTRTTTSVATSTPPRPVVTVPPKPKPAATVVRQAPPVVTSAPAPTAKEFENCTDMRLTYPHGVGLPGAQDSTSGTPVTTFKVSTALYEANTKSDADDDGIACEKR